MKKFSTRFLIFPLILFSLACGGRLPNEQRTTRLLREHFNDYAKEYKKSPFGSKKVVSVEILNLQEIHKDLITVQAFITMQGPDVYKVRVNIEKGPFGWRTVSWENLSGG